MGGGCGVEYHSKIFFLVSVVSEQSGRPGEGEQKQSAGALPQELVLLDWSAIIK
jgi:hypothetical protein